VEPARTYPREPDVTAGGGTERSEQAAQVTAEVEEFLRRELPAEWVAAIEDGNAEALAGVRRQLDVAEWWLRLADAGYATPTWPREYGGLGLDPGLGGDVARTLSKYKVPRFTNPIGVNLAGPAILRWGTPAQKERFLRPIARHQEIWCQMFSEPGAGSDLAGLSTTADRDGDTWLVSGQKVWTSYAHIASFGVLLARTNRSVPKRDGLTVFVMPVDQPGVTVRPLRHLTGDAEFNEVFFDQAKVPDAYRLGEVNEGWRVAISILMHERQGVAGTGAALPGTVTGRSVDSLLRRHAEVADQVERERLAQSYMEARIVELTNRRAAARSKAGQSAGTEYSVTKLYHSEHSQRLNELALDLEGLAGQAWPDSDRWLKNTAWSFLSVRSRTIAGGTSEIQRNVLGERILGLPKEPEVDRDIPWSEVRRS
jgi:alkylation response protein AidB-like acyl-CoA dehydrogenase